jgi:hypothetical protein
MSNIQNTSIARLISWIALMAITASVSSARQQSQDSTAAPLFAAPIRFVPALRLPLPSMAFSDTVTRALPLNQTRDDESGLHYVRPTFHKRLHHYFLHTYSPVKLTELAFGSAISQMDNVPPEWGQGWGAYGKRFASDLGSTTANGVTEFALAETLRVDTIYYPCTCKGVWPRVGHALKSTITARAGEDGNVVFSVPGVLAPYGGAFSTLLWFPSRYGPKDAFRTGNYDLLDRFGENIALEFLSPLLRKVHLH